MPMIREDLGRRFILTVCAAGSVHIHEIGAAPVEGTLPVFSTDTQKGAEALRVQHCRLARDGSGLYHLNERPKSVEELGRVSEMFRKSYSRMTSETANADPWGAT